MRYMLHLAQKNISSKPKKIITQTVFSYGKFLKEPLKPTKKQRLETIKNFFDSTR